MTVKSFKYLVIISLVASLLNCRPQLNYDKSKLTIADSIWIAFSNALIKRDVSFLINNSIDTIQCVDCILDSNKEYFSSNFIFNYHLKELMHIDTSKLKEYAKFQSDSLIRISFSIKAKAAEEGRYGLIFTFIKREDKYLFQGMYTIP